MDTQHVFNWFANVWSVYMIWTVWD